MRVSRISSVFPALFSFFLISTVSLLQAQETILLTPEKVMKLAREQSTIVQLTEKAVKGEEYARKKALTGFLPKVNGSVSYTYLGNEPVIPGGTIDMSQSIDPAVLMNLDAGDLAVLEILGNAFSSMSYPQETWKLGASVTQPLFTGGKLYYAYQASKSSEAAQEKILRRTREMTGLAGLRFFLGYLTLQESISAVDGTRSWLEKLVNDQKSMYEAQLIIEHDLLKTKVQLSSTELQILKMRNQLGTLEQQLLQFLGLPLTNRVSIDTSFLAKEQSVAVLAKDEIPSAVVKRSDIQAMRLQTDRLASYKKLQRSAYLPNLFGRAGYDWQNSIPDSLVGNWYLAAGLEWNLFDWGAAWRDIQSTKNTIEQMELRIKSMEDSVAIEIETAIRSIDESERALAISIEGVVNAQRALEIATLKYKEGIVTSTELLSARRELTQAQLDMITSRTNRVLAREAYQVAIGGV
jgi:outer membrane protein